MLIAISQENEGFLYALAVIVVCAIAIFIFCMIKDHWWSR